MRLQEQATVQLPGGLLMNGKLERTAILHPITGVFEQLLEDYIHSGENTHRTVSRILTKSIATVGGKPLRLCKSENLCVADRQFLMIQLSRCIAGDHVWVHQQCNKCTASFDVNYQWSAIPIKPAGLGFPVSKVKVDGDVVTIRTPTGADQEAIFSYDNDMAVNKLVQRCIVAVNDSPTRDDFFSTLTPEAIQMIEKTLDDAAPQLSTRIITQCPECSSAQVFELNPYQLPNIGGMHLFQDVHLIASHYHWEEPAIMALSRQRRHIYLTLIDRSRGKYA